MKVLPLACIETWMQRYTGLERALPTAMPVQLCHSTWSAVTRIVRSFTPGWQTTVVGWILVSELGSTC